MGLGARAGLGSAARAVFAGVTLDTYTEVLTKRGNYLFGIFPGASVSCLCTSFM